MVLGNLEGDAVVVRVLELHLDALGELGSVELGGRRVVVTPDDGTAALRGWIQALGGCRLQAIPRAIRRQLGERRDGVRLVVGKGRPIPATRHGGAGHLDLDLGTARHAPGIAEHGVVCGGFCGGSCGLVCGGLNNPVHKRRGLRRRRGVGRRGLVRDNLSVRENLGHLNGASRKRSMKDHYTATEVQALVREMDHSKKRWRKLRGPKPDE